MSVDSRQTSTQCVDVCRQSTDINAKHCEIRFHFRGASLFYILLSLESYHHTVGRIVEETITPIFACGRYVSRTSSAARKEVDENAARDT